MHKRTGPSEETKLKISQSLKGRPSPIKGRNFSEEHRKKISEAIKQKWTDPEYREKLIEAKRGERNSLFGKKHSEKAKYKMSEIKKGKRRSSETCQKISRTLKGKKPSEDIRRKLSEAQKIRWAKLSSEERRQQNKTWHLAGLKASQEASPSSLEIAIARILDALKINYEPQKPIGWYVVDFYIPEHSLIIECDGNYWHGLPNIKAKDKQRDKWLFRHGYKVLRLGEDAIRKDPQLALIKGLENKIGSYINATV